MVEKQLFSSEAVTSGHPDKIADQISDEVVDRLLELNPKERCAIEVLGTGTTIMVGGETSAKMTKEDLDMLVGESVMTVLHKLDMDDYASRVQLLIEVQSQSPEIANAVAEDDGVIKGAGDQGMMFGYAKWGNDEFMPTEYYLARKLMFKLEDVRKNGKLPYLRPDGKTQVTMDRNTGEIESILISTQHDESVKSTKTLARDLAKEVILPVMMEAGQMKDEDGKPKAWVTRPSALLINPAGLWTFGGMEADAGLTGRKIIFDTYGGSAPHGGGAYSGKSGDKVDRSASYMARFLAKNIVASGKGKIEEATVQLSYAIGVAEPVGLYITIVAPELGEEKSKILVDQMTAKIRKNVDMTPQGIIDRFGLQAPIYHLVSSGGHFGKEGLPWEEIDFTIFKK